MDYNMVPKVYEMDYGWIISNYLDPQMWTKTWTIYAWKDFVFTLSLYKINCETKSIVFKISCNKNGPWDYEMADYYLNNMSINDLKRVINGSVYETMLTYEMSVITKSKRYRAIKNSEEQENNYLREVASNFLDDNNVTNDDIREAYIDSYIDKHNTIGNQLSNYIDNCKYNTCTEMLLTYCYAIKDDKRLETIRGHYHNPNELIEIEMNVKDYVSNLLDGVLDDEIECEAI